MARFYETSFDVYFDDLDMFGILHNARYLLFMERGLGEFWKRLGWGGFDRHDDPDRFHLVRMNQLEYLRPVVGVQELRVRLNVKHIGNTSAVFSFRMMPMDEDIDYAVGQRVIVHIDQETRRPTPWSEPMLKRLTPYLEEQAG